MSEYYVADMTMEEKQQFLAIANSTMKPEDLGYGVSLFDGNNRWLGGGVFVSPTDVRVAGAFIPEVQGSGIWIQCVPIMFPKLFSVRPVFYMESSDSAILNVVKKLGAIDIEEVGDSERVWYAVDYTTAYLGDTVNTDFLSKSVMPPKGLSKYTVTDENGNTETFKTLFIEIKE